MIRIMLQLFFCFIIPYFPYKCKAGIIFGSHVVTQIKLNKLNNVQMPIVTCKHIDSMFLGFVNELMD